MFEGHVGEHHTEQSHRGVDDRHAQGERPWDGLTYRDTQVDGGGIMLQRSTARCTVGLQLFRNSSKVILITTKYSTVTQEDQMIMVETFTVSLVCPKRSYLLDPLWTCGQSPVARSP